MDAPVKQPKAPFSKGASSPEISLVSLAESTSNIDRKNSGLSTLVYDKDTTIITIDEANQTNFYNAPDAVL